MKSKLPTILKIIISGILLYVIFLKIDFGQLILSFRKGDIARLLIGVALGCGFNLVKFMKWHYLINAGEHNHSFVDGIKSYMIGNSLGMVTPLRAGDLGRALYFGREERARIMGLTVMDRFTELVVVLLLSIAGSFMLFDRGAGLVVLTVAVTGVVMLYSAGLLNGIFRGIVANGRIGNKLIRLTDILRVLDKKTISVILMFSIIAFLLCIIEFYFLISAFEVISLPAVFMVAPLITLSSILPVSLMGLGVREGISIVLLENFGISAPAAVSAAFLLFVINNASISAIGIIFLTKVKIKEPKSVNSREGKADFISE